MGTSLSSRCLIDHSTPREPYDRESIAALAAAVIDCAITDYRIGTFKEQQDAYNFLVKEKCGMWRHWVDLPPSWEKKFIHPAEKMTDDICTKVADMFREYNSMKRISFLMKIPYAEVRRYLKRTFIDAEIDAIEKERERLSKIGAVRDRLAGIACRETAARQHLSTDRVLRWLKSFLRYKGVDDPTAFILEMNKPGQGKVHDKCMEYLKEVEENGLSWN